MIDEPIYKLRVSENEKYTKEGEWFKKYIDFVLPYDTTVISNYKQMKLWYDVINDNLEGFKKELKQFCNPGIDSEISKEFMLDEEIVHYNRIFSKYSYLNGEMLKRADQFYASFLSSEAIELKDQELKDEIAKALTEQLLLKFEQTQMTLAGSSRIDAEDYLNEMKSGPSPEEITADFKSSIEIFANETLDYVYHSEELLRKKSLAFKHMVTSDRCVYYVGEKYGKPGIQVINPLNFGFHKSPDEYRIEKGDYAWSRTPMTMAEVQNIFGDQLDDNDLAKLGTYFSTLSVNNRHKTINQGKDTPGIVQDMSSLEMAYDDQLNKTTGQAQGSGIARRYNTQRLILVTHFEFKAFRELTFVTFIDEFGREITEVHPNTYDIPDGATSTKFTNKYGKRSTKYEWVDTLGVQYMAEKIFIPRRYEITRLGKDIYLNYREVPNQPLNLDDPYGSFSLSYKGRIMSSVNTESISLVGRAIPSQFQYNLIKHIETKEWAKYEGYIKNVDIDQIPDYLEEQLGVDKIVAWKYLRRMFGDSYYSGSQNSSGLPNPNKTIAVRPEVAGATMELFNLHRILEYIDREIGMSMAIPIQAQGQVSPNSNASDNLRNLQQGYTMIEWYMVEFSEITRSVLEEYLNQFTGYYRRFFRDYPNIKEHFLNYIVPNGSRKAIKILPKYLDYGNIGLFLNSNQSDEEYRQLMKTLALQPLAQNAGQGVEIVSTLTKAITSGASSAEVHKMIVLASKEQEERQKEFEKIRGQNAARLQAEKRQIQEDQQSHEIDKIVLESSLSKDADDIPKELEATKVLSEIRQKDRELDIKQQEANKAVTTN